MRSVAPLETGSAAALLSLAVPLPVSLAESGVVSRWNPVLVPVAAVLASTPLAQSRSIHLVRVGDEIVLVGTGEQGVTPIRVYTAEEARRLRIEPPEQLAPFHARPSADTERPGFFEALIDSIKKMTAR